MAERLKRYYQFAYEKGGMAMQIKLAMRTGMAQPIAEKAADSPENLERFEKALTELLPGVPLP